MVDGVSVVKPAPGTSCEYSGAFGRPISGPLHKSREIGWRPSPRGMLKFHAMACLGHGPHVSCAHLKPVIVQVYGSLLSASWSSFPGCYRHVQVLKPPLGVPLYAAWPEPPVAVFGPVRLGAEASRKGPSCTQHARGDVLMHAACARAPGCLVPMVGNSQTAGLRRPGSAQAPGD